MTQGRLCAVDDAGRKQAGAEHLPGAVEGVGSMRSGCLGNKTGERGRMRKGIRSDGDSDGEWQRRDGDRIQRQHTHAGSLYGGETSGNEFELIFAIDQKQNPTI